MKHKNIIYQAIDNASKETTGSLLIMRIYYADDPKIIWIEAASDLPDGRLYSYQIKKFHVIVNYSYWVDYHNSPMLC